MTEVTVTGIVDPVLNGGGYSNTWGYDFGGFFGPAGASLAGDAFTATWIGDYSTGLVTDATLTITGHTYDFGGNYVYDGLSWSIFRDDTNRYQVTDFGQVPFGNGTTLVQTAMLSLNPGGPQVYDGANGEAWIRLDDDASHNTQIFLTALPIPGPIVGTGPLSLAIFLCLLIARKKRARHP